MSAGSSLGPIKRLVGHALANNATIDLLVKGRIHTEHMTDTKAQTVDYPLIVISFTSGAAAYNTSFQMPVMDVYAYSKVSSGEASDLYDAVFDVLQFERLTHTELEQSCVPQEVVRPNEGYSESTRAWFCEGRWVVRSVG